MISLFSFYILILFIDYSFLSNDSDKFCIDYKNRVPWSRNFHFNNKEIAIKIDVSSRASHKILSNILKILLQERLGYKVVNFTYQNESNTDKVINRLSCIDNSSVDGNPVSHINIEAWIAPGYRFNERQSKGTIDLGPLGPTARKGVFVNTDVADTLFTTKDEILDYWKILDHSDKSCQSSGSESCYKIIYSGKTNVINEFEKISNVLYPNTTIVVEKSDPKERKLTQEVYSNELFWNWYPNVETVQGNYTRVLFPDCWGQYLNTTCDFEVNQLTKVIWSHLKDHASNAFTLINDFSFSHEEFVAILKDVNMNAVDKDDEYYQVACNWIRNNSAKWSQWTPGWNTKDQILLPIFVSDYEIWKAKEIIIASLEGVKSLNDHIFANTHYEIVPVIREFTSDEDVILSEYLTLIRDNGSSIMGFIVCLCPRTFNSLIKISDMQHRIIISSSVESTHNMNFTDYKYFFSTQPNMYHYNLVLITMFQKFNWTRLVILKKDENLVDDNILTRHHITVLNSSLVSENQINYKDTYAFLDNAIKQHKASIFVVNYLVHGTCIVMCAARNLGMDLSKGFVFILNPMLDPYWWKDYTSNECPVGKPLNREFFSIRHGTTSEHSNNYIRNKVAKFNLLVKMTQDAIENLGKSFYQLIQRTPSASISWQVSPNSETFVEILANQSQKMIGPTENYDKRIFNKNHERNGLWTIQRTAVTHGYMLALPVFKWNISEGFENGLPKFATVEKPMNNCCKFQIPSDILNSSDCPVEPLRIILGWSCTGTLIFINIFCVALILAFLIVCLVWYYRRQAIIMEDRFKKPFEDLCAELADIDIRSSDVVISLQVGKGAFGIVYGGEAKRNTRWESVAIKLIKKEADYQGKIDFLTEAKLMRNLEHPNIVKLIGICLNPLKPAIYLVMELVVNGDLEDYLLTNRITANKDPNNKMVCPSLLTRFVKNIAEGTEYLHKNLLLHRDLACRNCFLSEDYIVKIGDFGLTRNIHEAQVNQYYRTVRHFVLPARWMPPEAVQFGYFSIQSDIWSLGVVIFEVATFCSRPYFNVTDEEVAELVKRNSMPLVNYLPESAKNSDVYKLIDKCCQYKKDERPQSMSEVVKYIEDNPECIRAFITRNPPQPAPMGLRSLMNPYDNRQRPSSVASGGLNRFKSASRSRASVGNWAVFGDSQNNFDSLLQTESDTGRVAFPCNPDQVPFMPNESEFITVDQNTNRIGSKKRQKNNKKSSSNLNSSKSRSSEFSTNKFDDDQEQSYVSCPDQENVHGLGDFDVQDFPYNENTKHFLRSASGDEKSITFTKRSKIVKNGKILYNGSSRNYKGKTHKFGISSKSKSRLNTSQVLGHRKASETNGLRADLVEPLLYDRVINVCIQPRKSKNFKTCMNDEIC